MPFKRRNTASRPHSSTVSARSRTLPKHIAFFPLLILVLIVWVVYRFLFHFPVWFDETIGKAVFFGLPVWLYLSLTRSRSMTDSFTPERLEPGLLLGVTIGGIFGFAGILATLLKVHNLTIIPVPLFSSNAFWGEFFLAVMTGFWETLFFYSWVMVIVQEKFQRWSLVNQVLLTAVIFLIFHLPNIFLRFSPQFVIGQVVLLFFFAVGQAFLFAKSRNAYALMMSQAIWGMVLLIHTK